MLPTDKICNIATLAEATRSNSAIRAGVDNTPDDKQLANMKFVGRYIDAIDAYFCKKYRAKRAIRWASWFRNAKVNKLVKGSPSSFHMTGGAVDIETCIPQLTNKEIFEYCKSTLNFTELIWEYGTDVEPDWVHFACVSGREKEKCIKKIYTKDGKKVNEILQPKQA